MIEITRHCLPCQLENLAAFQRLYLPPSSGGTGERRNLSQMGPLERVSISTLN